MTRRSPCRTPPVPVRVPRSCLRLSRPALGGVGDFYPGCQEARKGLPKSFSRRRPPGGGPVDSLVTQGVCGRIPQPVDQPVEDVWTGVDRDVDEVAGGAGRLVDDRPRRLGTGRWTTLGRPGASTARAPRPRGG